MHIITEICNLGTVFTNIGLMLKKMSFSNICSYSLYNVISSMAGSFAENIITLYMKKSVHSQDDFKSELLEIIILILK